MTRAAASERLLVAAERLVARDGADRVTIRDIADEAGTNSAGIAYHFGSKAELLAAMYRRCCAPVVAERARLLAEAQARPDCRLEDLLDAFIRPTLTGEGSIPRMRAVLAAEQSGLLQALTGEIFDDSIRRFTEAFLAQLPGRNRADVLWGLHFLIGALHYSVAEVHRIRALSDGVCDTRDAEAVIAALIPRATAMLRA